MFTNDFPTLDNVDLLKLEVGDLIALESIDGDACELVEVDTVEGSGIGVSWFNGDIWQPRSFFAKHNVYIGGVSGAGYWTIIGIILAKNYD